MMEYESKTKPRQNLYQKRLEDNLQYKIKYTVGPDGFVYQGKISCQDFDKRYSMR
ncbi:hypothetical protein JXB28_01745 [Candidatus Woesearchaeota archaeon]|nr:hypothetical protein [Candidatus Woesearchaeota archaeon]